MNDVFRKVIIDSLNTREVHHFDYLKFWIYYKTKQKIKLKGDFDYDFLDYVVKKVHNEFEINTIQDKHGNILKYY